MKKNYDRAYKEIKEEKFEKSNKPLLNNGDLNKSFINITMIEESFSDDYQHKKQKS
jgi:hypothetical protein